VYQQQMQLNYMGSLHAAKAVYDDMVSRNSGHICFIASTLSLLGKTLLPHSHMQLFSMQVQSTVVGRKYSMAASTATGSISQAGNTLVAKHA
jgi:NAD(P)-dependent dehydrogenase (short-subunit alcohol dehydrogenase family)